jgi:putative membrane-bound dehydrogenase-like protein
MTFRRGCSAGRDRLGTVGVIATVVVGFFALPGQCRAQPSRASANGPISAQEAAKRIKLPEGFTVSVFAAEPDVVQPIAMTIDARGRLWVVENYSYPVWLGGPRGKDRILIFEDADSDGRFDRRTVFYDRGTNFTGIELGFGGVWVCATPNLLFFPDRDGDDRLDGEPEVALDGWDTKAQHNLFNGLKWGPDGWLWGCNGIMSNSLVGRPGTPADRRVPINCGVWRYHPTRKVFEAVAHGTTNPWGLDFDDWGEAFITNCVIPHLFHVVPGAHFQRMYGVDLAPHVYDLMESCADHLHWAGGRWQDSREGRGKTGEAGGGHAHVGAMIYLGDNWPDSYRNDVFTCNIHGRRINRDHLERRGSSYVATHQNDFLMANDAWFRGLELKYGPDGAAYLTDWYDTGECHENDADNAHRENGRIFKVAYGSPRTAKVDLSRETDEALVALQLHHNDWYVRTARRLLAERAAGGSDLGNAHRALRDIMTNNRDVSRRLRAIWALHATGGLDDNACLVLLDDSSEHVRAWGVRLACDAAAPKPAAVSKFVDMAKTDPSPKVLLALASALQRLSMDERWRVAEPLASRREVASDRMLPLMIWYGIEPLVASDRARAVSWAARCATPLLREYIARRTVAAATAGLAEVVAALQTTDDPVSVDLLKGAHEGLRGLKQVPRPETWPTVFDRLVVRRNSDVTERVLLLGLDVAEPKAVVLLRKIVLDQQVSADWRRRALSALVERRVPGLAPDLQSLLGDANLRGLAILALAAYEDRATAGLILSRYGEFSASERDAAVATLAARPASALILVEALRTGKIPRRDVSVSIARQLQAFGDRRMDEQLASVWGKLQPTSQAKATLMAKYKTILAADSPQPADPSRGRAIFDRTCLSCHRLYEGGGDVGPDLTGADRANPDYILENVLDPSAAVSRDYTLTNLATTDGRMISGIIREQSEKSVVIQTANERIVVSREDVEAIKPSTNSMMPEGQLENLAPQEIRDLFAYLASTSQVRAVNQDKR